MPDLPVLKKHTKRNSRLYKARILLYNLKKKIKQPWKQAEKSE